MLFFYFIFPILPYNIFYTADSLYCAVWNKDFENSILYNHNITTMKIFSFLPRKISQSFTFAGINNHETFTSEKWFSKNAQ